MAKKNIESNKTVDALLRFIKGMLIGTGAILPGVSGGALAAVFGLYEKIIYFLANLTKEFKKNFLYFLPVALGGVFGIFLLSFALSYFFENAETELLWFFVGCIAGILPALLRQAAKNGRKPVHLVIMGITAVVMLFVLYNLQNAAGGNMPLNFYTWIMAGAIFGLGLIVPGLSPSNILVYLNMYKPMTDGIKNLDFSVIIPLGIGAVAIILLLSKLMQYIFEKAYAGMFHIIIGVVLASTIIIIPRQVNYLSLSIIPCIITCLAGVILGSFMNRLEEKYKPE